MPILGIPPYIHQNIGLIGVQLGNQLDSSDGSGNAAVVYSTRSSAAPGIPATNAPSLIVASYDAFGLERRLDFGGGIYGTPDQNRIVFWTASTYTETPDTGLPRLSIEANGRVAIGDSLGTTGLFQVVDSALTLPGSVGLFVNTPGGAHTHRIAQALTVGGTAAPSTGAILDVIGAGGLNLARSAATSGATNTIGIRYTAAAHTAQSAGVEVVDVDFRTTGALQHSTGALTTQRTGRYQARTYSFVGASTITNAATLAIEGAPIAGTNATITNPYALWVQAGETHLDGPLRITPIAASSGIPIGFRYDAAAHTGLTASTEFLSINFNLANTIQHATGALTTQRAFLVQAPTYSFVGASTITNSATLAVSAAPVAGTNATITNSHALWVQAGRTKLDGDLKHAGTNLGFFTATETTQKTGGENLTNNVTSGGTTGTVDNWTDLTIYATDAAAIRNAIYQLARALKQDHDALRAYGLLT